jgi:hypothetical protein
VTDTHDIPSAPLAVQDRLIDLPMVGLYPTTMATANGLLVAWGHKLGPVHRPFRQEAFALELDGDVLAIATSGSIVNGPVAGYERDEVVELTRLASSVPWANRIMLRLWREACAPRWGSWPVRAAISYSHNAMHRGDIYRFDGWEKVRDDAGSSGGGTWGRKRLNTEAVYGKKTLWVWRYEGAA